MELSQRPGAAERREAEMRAGNAFITEDGREAIWLDDV
jgi:hypothetical protein